MKPERSERSWLFYSKLILMVFAFLQILHWPLYPLFMDIHYHLLTAWGYSSSGGYSGWDYLQFAPVGRVQLYPPLFSLLLSIFLKIGINKIILAKSLEIILPLWFLFVSWKFIKDNYGIKLGFFVLLMFCSSFSFFLTLVNHLPSTLGLIFGISALDSLYKDKFSRAGLFIGLCFYTHIGVSWFFLAGLLLFAAFEKRFRSRVFSALTIGVLFALPMIIREVIYIHSFVPLHLNEQFLSEFKTIDYFLAVLGIFLCWDKKENFRLFPALLLASLVFCGLPYRFFSGEGYLPVVFLAGIAFFKLYELLKDKKNIVSFMPLIIVGYFIFLSPTLLLDQEAKAPGKGRVKVYYFDSAFFGLIFPEYNTRLASATQWFPHEYFSAAEVIRNNSLEDEIIYSPLPNLSVCLASLSRRATANGLFPEVPPVLAFDPITVSRLIIFLKTDPQAQVQTQKIVSQYMLERIYENRLFIIYKNPKEPLRAKVRKADFPYILLIPSVVIFSFFLYFYPYLRERPKRGDVSKFYR